ncbi:MAG: hypothetical protein ACFE0I_02420 [Elainellaceae cyanobacterium]
MIPHKYAHLTPGTIGCLKETAKQFRIHPDSLDHVDGEWEISEFDRGMLLVAPKGTQLPESEIHLCEFEPLQ